jgi:hypothetical protein
MTIIVDAKYVRAVATWLPLCKANDKFTSLSKVALWAGEGSLTTMVTDRYRMIHSVVPLPNVTETNEKPILIGMDLFTRFVAAAKTLPDNSPVTIEVGANSVWLTTTSGLTLSDEVSSASYPDLPGWVEKWHRAENNVAPNFKWEMKRLADLHKLADPNVGVVTAARRDYAWSVTCGDAEALSSAWRFDQ